MRRALWRGCSGERGAAVVEFAIVLPVLLLCVLGLIEFGRAIWTQAALDYAVEAAARCAAIDTLTCSNAALTQQYAAARTPGMTLPATTFSVTTAACGMQVSASLPFDWLIPPFISDPLFPQTLTAQACFPL